MVALLVASYKAFMREFPARAVVSSFSWPAIVGVVFLQFVLGFVEPGFELPQSIDGIMLFILSSAAWFFGGWLLLSWIAWRFLSTYAVGKFSFRDMCAIEVVFTSFGSIIFAILGVLSLLTGETGAIVVMVAGLGIVIYILLTYQKGLAQLASITQNQAAAVILVPAIIAYAVSLGVGIFGLAAAVFVGGFSA